MKETQTELELPKSCQQLLDEHHIRCSHKGFRPLATTIDFILDSGESVRRVTTPIDRADHASPVAAEVTVYNITRPFGSVKNRRLAGRTESRNSERDSRIVFFEEELHNHRWRQVPNAPVLDLQDPFHIENVQGYNIIGGVQIWEHDERPGHLTYRTVFYRYRNDITELTLPDGTVESPFACGPDGMKDIRLIELANGRVGVFTRPQGATPAEGGRGKIGYTEIDDLGDLTSELISDAPLITNLFRDNEWGGANELHLLSNGSVGVLGHIAEYVNGRKDYYPITFCFDPDTRTAWGMKIIASAENFPARVGTKIPELRHIIFSGGLMRQPEGDALLYAGVGDVAAGVIYLDEDPFSEYELSSAL